MEFLKLKNTMTEIKSFIDGLNSRMMGTKGRISKLGDKTMETTQPENRLKKQIREEQSLRDLWDSNKRSNICVISIPEGRKEGATEKALRERMAENSPNLARVAIYKFKN